MKQTLKIKVIGAGGIGSHLIEPLSRYLGHKDDYVEITVIDGDRFEARNKERQRMTALENKAQNAILPLKDEFPKIHFRAKSDFITEDNVVVNVREGDIVFLCVDNDATRKLVSERCEELDDVTLISGGNEYTDGDVLYYRRKGGNDVAPTKSLTALYPKIANPKDKNPGLATTERLGCEAQVTANPQLLFTNNAIASTMLNVYYAHEQGKADFNRVFVDILSQRNRPSPEKQFQDPFATN